MSEPAIEDRVESPAPTPAESSDSILPAVRLGSAVLRFDGPEQLPGPGDEPGRLPSVAESAAPRSESAKRLADVGQMLLQFQQHMDDVERREEQLTQRLTTAEQEERRFRLWANETEAELAERKAAQLAAEAALTQRMADFDRERSGYETALEQLEAERRELDRERSELRREMQQEVEAERSVLAAEREVLNEQQAKVKELGDELLAQHSVLQARNEEQLQAEREKLWLALTAEWEEQRAKFERERADYFKDRTLLENRLRFQQEHLEKTRAELDHDQQETLRMQQIARERIEAAERQLQFRKAHVDRYRETLDELDRALEREREVAARLKESMSTSAEQEIRQSLIERQEWEADRSRQQVELRRQQEMLLTHTEHLETRRLRLEALRREVEETSHSTMELRFAVEDVWAQLQQSLGLTVTQEKVEQARQAVARDYEHWQARLWEQRRELHEAERQLEQQRLAFQEERRTLTDWIAARDQELLQKEQQHSRLAAELETEDRARQEIQERWLREKDEAERVIRRLLGDLVDRASSLPEPDASTLAGRISA